MSERRTELSGRLADQSPDQWVADCWSDMQQRWGRQDYVRVEDYLPPNFQDVLPSDALIDLVYGEYILCKEYELPVDHSDYTTRFPQLSVALQRQFALDDALSSEVPHEFGSTLTGSSEATALAVDPIPERIGKYVVVSRIGVGGQAEIFRAVHPTLGKEVVLKLARQTSSRPIDRTRMESEAQILSQIEHPNLARVFDLDFHEGRPFLVMEFIRGRTLEQFAHQEKPTPTESAALLAKVARGVAAAHRRGTAHLDIKPSNVLVDEQGEPRLIDFGLAHLEDAWHEEVLEQNSLRGTLHFMAPEQALGAADEIDFRADIFALGGLLYFLLTSSAPYPKGTRFPELLEQVQSCNWDQEQLYHRRIPPRLRSCCTKAMDAAPEQRFVSAETLARELDRCSPGVTPYGWVMAGAAALLLVALGITTYQLTREDGTTQPVSVVSPIREKTEEPGVQFATKLIVQIWDEDRFRDLVDAVPAVDGDHVRVTANAPANSHYSLFALNSEGMFDKLGDGVIGEESDELRYPEPGKAVPLSGPTGTELILFCGRLDRPINADEINSYWDSERLVELPDHSIVRLDQKGVAIEGRGREFGSPVDLLDPESAVRERLEAFRKMLKKHTDFYDAVAFCHK